MISFLLVLVLCIGLVPGVSAAEVDAPGAENQTEAAEAEETLPPTTEETTTPEEPTPEEPPAEATLPEESVSETESIDPPSADVPLEEPGLMDAIFTGASVMSIASTQNSIMLFDYADNGNYTTVLNYQVACAYKPNGSGTTRTAYIKNMGWHFARYGGVAYPDDPLYCIEPWRSYGASTSGNSVDRGVTMDGSGSTTGSNVWYAMPAARREAIGLILLYSNQMWNKSISVTTTKRDSNPNVPLRVATQMLIYEIVCGLRDPSTFTLNDTNECGTDGDVFYNAGAASLSGFTSNYNSLVSAIQSAKEIPSFTSASSSTAPTITMTGDETSVYDNNGVLPNFSFTDGNGAEFYRSGYTLYITRTGTISESKVFNATRYLPSAASSTYNIWYMSGSTYQTTISLASASSGSLNAYFKIKAPSLGNISLTKTTEDGKNLSGWRFGVYTNSACTSLAAGPYTTDTNGKISITGLSAGTYYVKELGHTDSTVNALYYCASTNPQAVTVTAGGTAAVSFTNKLNTGGVKLVKKTNTGKNLSGWQIGLYTDSSCTNAVSGSPFTTGTDGTVSVTGLVPGTYYAKEIAISDPYWVCDSAVKTITVTANGTATVTFTNTHTGDIRVQKNAINGSAEGWSFQILDSEKNVLDTIQTGADGFAYSGKLAPGKYFVREVHDRDETYWEYDATVEKEVTVTAGSQAEVSYTNKQYGRIEIKKTTNTGNHLGGWTFRVKDASGNTIGDFTTDENGYACAGKLEPGRYTIVELPTEDNFWSTELGFHDAFVKAGETAVDTWLNKEQGLGWICKKTNTGASVEGWHFTVYEDEACTQKVGTVITNEAGKVGYYLDPGTYWVKETGDEHGRFEDEYWMVDESIRKIEIRPHEETIITFTNVQYGKMKVVKTVQGDASVEGWQFKITDSEGKELEGSPFLTDQDGFIQTGNLLPGTYTVEELLPEDSLYECTSENPQTVTVKQGEIAEVSFVNALRTGTVKVEKIDITGSHLAGATFRLEWSEEGALWYPVTYSNTVVRGSCSNPNVKDGSLTTGADGLLEWGGLYPGLQYRLTETKAPEGYKLLTKPAYEGELPGDDLVLTVHVTNTRTFTMPDTGGNTAMIFRILSMFSGTVCLVMLIYSKKRLV